MQTPPDDERAARLRRDLFAQIAARPAFPGSGPWDARVLDALARVPRHAFVPEASLEDAYTDAPLSIGEGQTISQPTIVAVMTQALEIAPHHTVLEIGTGCGYQSAILACLAGRVSSIEVIPSLGRAAASRLARLGYAVEVTLGDGYAGLPDAAPFDRIVLTAAPPRVPDALVAQLAEDGILLAPVGPEGELQELVRHRKRQGVLHVEPVAPVRFVPMVPGSNG